ncbi:hypothetical protein BV20DRAFT_1075618 [Pilatotrama ljubarskyi]|nr:hypothetical protein BV20DRAFT_1075618 [Pilatotrama ljubarskyi]
MSKTSLRTRFSGSGQAKRRNISELLNPHEPDVQAELAALRNRLPGPESGPVVVPSHVYAALHVLLAHFNDIAPFPHPRHSASEATARPQISANRSPLLPPPEPIPPPEQDVKLNRQTTLELLFKYPSSATLEYPQTSATGSVGHLLRLDPTAWEDPCQYIVYARGAPNGASAKGKPVYCEVLRDPQGAMVPCRRSHSTCQGCKVCPMADETVINAAHTSASREELRTRLRQDREARLECATPTRTVFERTVSRLAAYRQYGCGAVGDRHDLAGSLPTDPDSYLEQKELLVAQERARHGHRRRDEQVCSGRLLYLHDFDGAPFIQCEFYGRENRMHLIDYSIRDGSYDLEYLEAAFRGDTDTINYLDQLAEREGYGPRVRCNTITNCTSVRVNCPGDHRDGSGRLIPQEMARDLPDLTPRRLLRHPVLHSRLRELLPALPYPSLSDLHISLANREHLRSYLKDAKEKAFPFGTGWDGLLHLKAAEDRDLAEEDVYIRYMAELSEAQLCDAVGFSADECEDEVGETEAVRIAVCMTRTQSRRLLAARYLQSDIAFKRVIGFKEFELGSWDEETRTAMVYCRPSVKRMWILEHYKLSGRTFRTVSTETPETSP